MLSLNSKILYIIFIRIMMIYELLINYYGLRINIHVHIVYIFCDWLLNYK